jgi:hypothetical protein
VDTDELMDQVFDEHGIDANEAIQGLLHAMLAEHMRVKRQSRAVKGVEVLRATVLDQSMHIVRLSEQAASKAGDAQQAALQAAVLHLLTEVWVAAERELGDDDDAPPLRLVRD